MTVRDLLVIVVPLTFTVIGFMRWQQNGYWIPKFIHALALFGLLIGIGLAWMSFSTDAPNKSMMWSIVILMPLLVYWAYLLYGGGIGIRRFNDFLSMHASMNEDDVLHLLKKEFGPYRNRSFAELSTLIAQPDRVKLNGPSGRQYELQVAAQTDRDDRAADIDVFGALAEIRPKGGTPIAHVMFSKSKAGVISNDALNTPFRSALRR